MYYSCGCSCSCGDDPCACQQVVCPQCTTTSTTTMAPCIGEQCDELYDCKCIIYNGPDLACYGIYHGDNLCRILEIAASNLPSCTITPPPTTTTTTCACVGYNVVAKKGSGAISYSYIPCGASKEIIEYLSTAPTKSICTQRGSIPQLIAGNASITPASPECCVPTTTTTTASIQRCLGYYDYYTMERQWGQYLPQTYKVVSIKLNGIEYVNSNTPILSINSTADIHVGTGLDGNTYTMDVSDWLNSITIGSGFVFHDDMKVIDKPYASATFYIEIIKSDSIVPSQTYYYTSDKGYSFNGQTWYPYTCTTLVG